MIRTTDSPLLKTKMYIPELKERMVTRKRLIDTITEGFLEGKRLVTIVAPAGYGKSTLLAQWAESTGMACAWLSLDAKDNDPARFWKYLTAALAATLPEPTRKQFEANCQWHAGASLNSFLDTLISGLSEPGVNHAFVLVLDDLHEIQDRSTLEGLSYLLDYMPDSMYILMSSRLELPIPGVKRLASGTAMVINTGQLQFTAGEIECFIQLSGGQAFNGITSSLLDELHSKTEGWVTGLQLLALSRRAGNRNPWTLAAGGDRYVSEYLLQEVLHSLPTDLFEFLLQTSVLSRMDAAACNALTGRPDSRKQLDELLKLNLFLVPLDGSRTWFRYHHLFAQFLQDQLRRQDEAGYAAAHRLAGTYFSEIGAPEDAIDHLIAAGESELALQALEQHIPSALKQGELSTLLNWFGKVSCKHTLTLELATLHAFLLVLAGHLEHSEELLGKLEEEIDRLAPSERQDQLRSGVLFVRSNLVFLNGNFSEWLAFSEKVGDHLIPNNPVYYLFDYNLQEPYVRRTSLGMKGTLSEETEMVGKLFIGVLEGHGWKNSLLHLYVKQSLAEGYYEWNRLDDCRKLLMQLRSSGQLQATPGLYLPVLLTEARMHAAEGKLVSAHHTLDEALEASAAWASDKGGARWNNPVRAVRSNLYLKEGRIPDAKRELALLDIGGGSKPIYSREVEYLALARLLGRQRKEAEALPILELLKLQAQREQQVSSVVEITCLQALVEAQRGQRTLAFGLIEEALQFGRSNNYIRTFVDEGPEMQHLLKTYLAERSKGLRSDAQIPEQDSLAELLHYVESLIQSFPDAGHCTAPPSLSLPELMEPLNSKELLLVEQLRLGATNKQMAAALGLTEGTIRVYLSRLYEKLGVSTRTQALVKTQGLR